MTSPQMESIVRDIQDTLVVMAHIEKRHTERLQELLQFRERTEDLQVQSERWQRRADERYAHILETIAEIGDKLNGLIGYIDGQKQ